jgi:carboxyl-terminal processing protease
MKKLFLWIALPALFLSTTFAFKSAGPGDPESKQQLLTLIRMAISQAHTNNIAINDDFSRLVWQKYISFLDPNKQVFLQSDIDQLKKYETTIDDEINGAPISFYAACLSIYTKRLAEAEAGYIKNLQKPFDFSKSDKVLLEPDSIDFARSPAALNQRWKDELKYRVLDNLLSLQTQRSASATTDPLRNKTDAELEKESREKVQKQFDRTFLRLKSNLADDKQFALFLNSITEIVDPHTTYMPPADKRAFDESMSRKFYGIGAGLKEEDGLIKVTSLEPGSPAWKSKMIDVNDIISKVGQGPAPMEDITGMALSDAVKLIRGDKNTEVRLLMKKADGTEKTVIMIRDEIVQEDALARSAVINNNGKKIGYIYLSGFYADFKNPNGAHCAADVAKELVNLKKENIEGLILDLRNNGGGSLQEVVKMLGLFIKNGPMVQVKGRSGNPQVLRDNDEAQLYAGPLVVMVNALSASASEIFAAAIQDYKRGIIIGSTSTYGKGTVQTTYGLTIPATAAAPAKEFGAIKLTIQKFYRVNGGSTQLKGVVPDVILPDPYDFMKLREKDKVESLKWDQIAAVDFNYPPGVVNEDGVIRMANDRLKKDPTFGKMTNDIDWFGKHNERRYDLSMASYKLRKDSLKIKSDELKNLQKLPKGQELQLSGLTASNTNTTANPVDEAKNTKFKEWIKSLSTDVYLKEATQVTADMMVK